MNCTLIHDMCNSVDYERIIVDKTTSKNFSVDGNTGEGAIVLRETHSGGGARGSESRKQSAAWLHHQAFNG